MLAKHPQNGRLKAPDRSVRKDAVKPLEKPIKVSLAITRAAYCGCMLVTDTRKMDESRRLTAASERTRLNRTKNQLRFLEQ